MPALDSTGPLGRGPASGRGLGPCRNGASHARENPPASTYGLGRGGYPRGGGRGLGRGGRFFRT